MINKIKKLERLQDLTIELLKAKEENQIINIHNLIDYLKNNNFNKSNLLDFIYILLNTINYNNNNLKEGVIVDGFAFWCDDLEGRK